MKISEQWLRQWVNPPVDTKTLAHQLTMAGLEVDDVSPAAAHFKGIVVGEVLSVDPHPDADRLRVTRVSIGNEEPLQIVCGAPNVATGQKVPVATVGAVLPGGLQIKKGKLRGVESQGMLCGASEIGLEDVVDGLLILPPQSPVGQDIRELLSLDDQIIELGITPNRGDCLSGLGLAREVAAINGLALNTVDVEPVPVDSSLPTIPVEIRSKGCGRYVGRLLSGMDTTKPTPEWMVQRLSRSGIRAHSMLVDVTNYVMLELGQPMHAFDADAVPGIVVRTSCAGESLTLLNDQTVTLDDDTLLICAGDQPVALAGVMGGKGSSVQDQTQRIILESAWFHPLAIAGRARRYGLHTDSSQRFERGVDPGITVQAIERATALIMEIAGGSAGPLTIVESGELPKQTPILLSPARIQRLLGTLPEHEAITGLLERLGMQVETTADGWQVTPPSWRFDVAIPEDLVEEIARMVGYDHLPTRLPHFDMALRPTADRLDLQTLRHTLVMQGYQEAISFSFSDLTIEKTLNPEATPLALANPISSELGVMRSTLLSSLLPCVQYNRNRQQQTVRFFETGLRFLSASNQAIQDLAQIPTLAMIAMGSAQPESWHGKPQPVDFFDFKGDIQHVLSAARCFPAFVRGAEAEFPWLHPGLSARLELNGKTLGYLGRLHPNVEQALDLGPTWVAEMDIHPLQQPFHPDFTELSRFPHVRRDLAFLIDATISIDQLFDTIRQAAGPQMSDLWLFDVYTGQSVPTGQRSLAVGMLWQEVDRTLEDHEIRAGMQRVIDQLTLTHGIAVRAS